ncbi:MAG TPA: hypothetical protein VGN24_07230 [Rhodanobacter sp.]|jgi:hypothetical protein|nr:hypothetical protein [Rhodanobacter sp.]
MFMRMAMLGLGLGLTAQAAAAGNKTPPQREICRQSTPVIRELWAKGAYDAPPAVATLMLDAIDGKLPELRRQLQAMQPTDAARWRQLAMLTAAWTGQPSVVDGLLDDGAAVNAKGWIPPFKPGFFGQTVDAMQHDSRLGGPAAVNGLMATGVVGNEGHSTAAALTVATECGDVATLDVLLHHHADVAPREASNVADPLTVATVGGDAAVVRRLLDHGADPCADDRRIAQFRLQHPTRPTHTLAQIGTRVQLPTTLVARLTCPAVAETP